jgi:transcriptional regulator with XRE-family HTH domain
MPDNQRGKRKTAEDLNFNAVVGQNIKYLRKYKRLNQTKVANHCKIKFQQLQKYEKGINGCSAFRLQQLANFFGVKMEVLVDPQMITKHRGFSEEMEWQQYEADIERQLTEQEIIDKYKKSVGHKCP